MSPRAKLFLVLAAGGTVAAIALSKKKAQAAEPPEQEEAELPIELPLPEVPEVTLPPQRPVEIPIPLPGDVVPPPIPIPIDEDDERDDIVLEPIAPPFVPEPISQPRPRPEPIPVPPPELIPEEVLEEIPDIIPTPVLGPAVPVQPPPVIRPPIPQPEPEEPEADTNLAEDTAQVLGVMLGRESTADWKRNEPLLQVWQENRGLTADGKFGPGTALAMAQETGLLPIVRFWPRGTLPPGAVEDYQADLIRLSQAAEEPRKSQLLAASQREQGQGFDRNPRPISPIISL